ncbi:MAG TPA: PepSY-associated TM helix domain-containing protein [Bryobacteraceae bacterium]|nr:PepSY-associated TM helix domain-containing protein [Bryobacteraceae bacterium]
MQRPQHLWLRKALFQIHLWTGIAFGLYVLAVSVSGSAIVFRNEVYQTFGEKPKIAAGPGPRLTEAQLKAVAEMDYPGYAVTFIWKAADPDQATEIWMERNGSQKQRLFNPYTGQDLGPSVPVPIRFVSWMSDLHTNLLLGDEGRKINGGASVLLCLLSLTGLILWWPGVRNWRRSLTIRWRARWKRLNWDMHSAVGFWMFLFLFMWGSTGVYVVFPTPFQRLINSFAPLDYYRLASETAPPAPVAQSPAGKFVLAADSGASVRPRRRRRFVPHYSIGDEVVRWITYLHFGNFAGWKTKALWVILGLTPAFLFLTGVLMWWNRVLSKEARRLRRGEASEPEGLVA